MPLYWIDGNGFNDLVLAREDDVYIVYNTDGVFTHQLALLVVPAALKVAHVGFFLFSTVFAFRARRSHT